MSTSEADWTFNKLHSMCVGSAGGSITFYVKTFITNLYIIIVGTPLLQGEGWGVEPPTKFSLSRGLTGPQLLEGVAGKERGDFFQGGCNFHIKIN